MKFLHRHTRPVEVLAVIVATIAAGAVIAGIEAEVLDLIGPWADIVAGGLMAVTGVGHWIDHRRGGR